MYDGRLDKWYTMYERTAATVKIESLKIQNQNRLKGLSMAKMCSFFSQQYLESLASGMSDNKVNKESDQAKH